MATWEVKRATPGDLELPLRLSPDFRGRGVARTLLERAVEDGVAAGARAFRLEVEEANPVARALYEKFGFQLRGYRRMMRRA